jgi:DNA transformation protein
MQNQIGRQYADEIANRLAKIGLIEVKRFFGGYGLVHAGAQFAFVMKGSLFFYVNDQTREQYVQQHSQAFSYSTKIKQVIVNSH